MAHIEQSKCTNCGRPMRGVSCVHGEQIREKGLKTQSKFELDEQKLPGPGDVTVCLICGHLMAFDEKLQLRNLTDAEEIAIAGNPALLIIQRARTAFMKTHGADVFATIADVHEENQK